MNDNKQYVLSLSYGKDSLACLGAIEELGLPLDRIVHAEVWATDDIPAELPPMIEFKNKADKIIKDRWGIDVEHYFARDTMGGVNRHTKNVCINLSNTRPRGKTEQLGGSLALSEHGVCEILNSQPLKKLTYERIFYSINKNKNKIYGFPMMRGNWCTSKLKTGAIREIKTPSG